jgi:CheY-like chemotaxis protein
MMDVYIVDDSAEIAQMLRIVLDMEGYTSAWAHHGDEALAWLRAQGGAPALLLVDLSMPGMDGATFIRQIMDLPHLRRTQIVVMTADNAPASRLLGLPISAVLRKPFDIDELLQLVEQMRMPAAA